MNPKTKFVLKSLFAWWLTSLLLFIVAVLFVLPTILFFQIYFQWFNDPFNIIGILQLILLLNVIPPAQVVWAAFLFALFERDKSFTKSFNDNINSIAPLVLDLQKTFKKKRRTR